MLRNAEEIRVLSLDTAKKDKYFKVHLDRIHEHILRAANRGEFYFLYRIECCNGEEVFGYRLKEAFLSSITKILQDMGYGVEVVRNTEYSLVLEIFW